MTRPFDNKQLKTGFQALRDTEAQAAPDYQRPTYDPTWARPNGWFRPALRFATATAMLIVAITLFTNSSRDRHMPEVTETVPYSSEKEGSVIALEMPTDFLLETPWFELARTTPDFGFEPPHYDAPEDLSDEI